MSLAHSRAEVKDSQHIAVVGAGNIAQQHLSVLRDVNGVQGITLIDRAPDVLKETGDRFGIEHRLTSHHELLERSRPAAAFRGTRQADHADSESN